MQINVLTRTDILHAANKKTRALKNKEIRIKI